MLTWHSLTRKGSLRSRPKSAAEKNNVRRRAILWRTFWEFCGVLLRIFRSYPQTSQKLPLYVEISTRNTFWGNFFDVCSIVSRTSQKCSRSLPCLVAPYRAILRYYRCDISYRAILFQGGQQLPKVVRYPPWILHLKTSTQEYCDTIASRMSRYEKYRCWASKPPCGAYRPCLSFCFSAVIVRRSCWTPPAPLSDVLSVALLIWFLAPPTLPLAGGKDC